MIYAEKRQSHESMDLEERIETYWNRRSANFSRVRRHELEGPDGRLWLELLERHLPQGESLRILDAGTGAGFFAILLAGKGHRVTGIDMSEDMLREAKKNMMAAGCRAEFRKMSAQKPDFPDGVFDAIVSRNLTWTLPDVMEAYREWYRLLKPGGMLLNFDADWGRVTFSKTADQANVHADIEDDLIAECNAIKDGLRITTHRRPAWDIHFLESLGFSVEHEENITPFVHQDGNFHYDEVPLFAIYGRKSSGDISGRGQIKGDKVDYSTAIR